MNTFFAKPDRILEARWNLVDIAIVWILSMILLALLAIATMFLISEDKVAIKVFRYAGFLIGISLPFLWIKFKYGLTKRYLGLRKGEFSYPMVIIFGISSALIFSLLFRISPFWRSLFADSISEADLLTYVILLPISVGGFADIVLTPLWEETMFRGFIYGYLRSKVGIIPGLFLQALIFSISHTGFLFGDSFYQIIYIMVIGVILGLLYEYSGSIYSSIICHGIITYTLIIFSIYWR